MFYYQILFSTVILLCCSFWHLKKKKNTLHYCSIAMEISSERNAHWRDTDLRVERIRNSANCEQVQDKKPLSHDKLNIELWGLAKLRTIHSPIHSFSGEILKESDNKKGVARVLFKGMESQEFINIYMDFIGHPHTFTSWGNKSKWCTDKNMKWH